MSNKTTLNIKPPQESSIKLCQALNLIFDPLLLERAVQYAANRFTGARITKILLLGADVVPLGAVLAHGLGVSWLSPTILERQECARSLRRSTFPVTFPGTIAS